MWYMLKLEKRKLCWASLAFYLLWRPHVVFCYKHLPFPTAQRISAVASSGSSSAGRRRPAPAVSYSHVWTDQLFSCVYFPLNSSVFDLKSRGNLPLLIHLRHSLERNPEWSSCQLEGQPKGHQGFCVAWDTQLGGLISASWTHLDWLIQCVILCHFSWTRQNSWYSQEDMGSADARTRPLESDVSTMLT